MIMNPSSTCPAIFAGHHRSARPKSRIDQHNSHDQRWLVAVLQLKHDESRKAINDTGHFRKDEGQSSGEMVPIRRTYSATNPVSNVPGRLVYHGPAHRVLGENDNRSMRQ